MTNDTEQLKLLSLFHYILGLLSGLCACFPFLYLAIGIAIVSGVLPASPKGTPPPEFVGWSCYQRLWASILTWAAGARS